MYTIFLSNVHYYLKEKRAFTFDADLSVDSIVLLSNIAGCDLFCCRFFLLINYYVLYLKRVGFCFVVVEEK